jgi:predicted transcriptional regulator
MTWCGTLERRLSIISTLCFRSHGSCQVFPADLATSQSPVASFAGACSRSIADDCMQFKTQYNHVA